MHKFWNSYDGLEISDQWVVFIGFVAIPVAVGLSAMTAMAMGY